MLIILLVVALIIFLVYAFLQHPQFGQPPSGARLARIQKSSNYHDGAFHNKSHTPPLAEGVTYTEVLKQFFFDKKERLKPAEALPSVKTDLFKLDPKQNVIVWFGHSSYFMQVDGRRFLVDPVFSGSASPLPFGTKAFKGADVYTVADMPGIDYLFITHDHWDHLDYSTVKQLKPKVKRVITSLGTGEHLERWGYDPRIISEKDWDETEALEPGFTIHTISARHFSGRTFKRNQALWISFVLQTPTKRIFIGGDSGYDTHFAEAGNRFGPFDLAILENGQYNKNWKYIHMLPDELPKAATELKAKRLFPVHSSKFALSLHPWDEPLIKVTENSKNASYSLATPMIGEPLNLDDPGQVFSQWWKPIQ